MPVADSSIEHEVERLLESNLSLMRDTVSVRAVNGWVILSGRVQHDFQRGAAEYGVRDVPGVIGLTNRITVKANARVNMRGGEL